MKQRMMILIATALLCSATLAQVEFNHPKVIEHGKINQGDIIKGEIQFVNKGTTAVTLSDIRASCGCTAVKPEKMTFAPGETAHIPYTISTERFSGVIRKSIRLVFQDENPPAEVIYVEANITSEVNINPRFINFQKVTLNPDTVYTEFFEIENNSDSDLQVTEISVVSEIVKVSPASVVIPAGKSHLIRVDLVPDRAGRQNASILVNTGKLNSEPKRIPVFINITAENTEHSE